LGFILGPMIETSLRQTLILSRGSFGTIITRPISGFFLAVTLIIAISAIFRGRKTGTENTDKNENVGEEGSLQGDRITGLFGLLFALYIIKESLALNIGGIHQPGPGFFPLFGGTILAVFSTVLLFRVLVTLRAKGSMPRGQREKRRWTVVYAYIGFIVYSLIFEWLGFILSTFLLVIFLLRILEPRKWWSMLLTAAIVASSAYTVFNVFLKSELPMGILGSLF
jgi:putative tricarboxylic transport membrane protein